LLVFPASAAVHPVLCCAADSAFFWAAGANTSGITGAWLDIAREVRQFYNYRSNPSKQRMQQIL
jgi:hypothetical protein